MKRDDLLDSIGGIDREILEESQKLRKDGRVRGNRLFAVIPIAAAAVLVFGVVSAVLWNARKSNTAQEGPGSGIAAETLSLQENTETGPGPSSQELTAGTEDAVPETEEPAREASAESEREAAESVNEAETGPESAEVPEETEKGKPVEYQLVENQEKDGDGHLLLGVELLAYEEIPEEIRQYILDHTSSIRTEIMNSPFAEEAGIEKDLGDLLLLRPFVIYRSDGTPVNTEYWLFPVMSKNRIICQIGLTEFNGEILLEKTVNFSDDLNALLGMAAEHRVVLKERKAASSGESPAVQMTGGELPPEYEYPETGKSISAGFSGTAQYLYDLSIQNSAAESAFQLIPDYNPFLDRWNTHVYYYDDHYAVFRIHHDEEQRLVLMKNDGNGWNTASDIHSGKKSMSDRASEITAAMEDFYSYYMKVWEPGLIPQIDQMCTYLRKAAVPNRESIDEENGPLMYTNEELDKLRSWVILHYDPDMSEKWVPSLMAIDIAGDFGFSRLTRPMLIFRMDCEDSEDPEMKALIAKEFGDLSLNGTRYYLMAGHKHQDNPNLYNCRLIYDESFLASDVRRWTSGKYD